MNNTAKKNRMNNLKDYIEAFSHLHTAKVKRRKAPHKAVLLLAIMDLVECNFIRNPRIELTDELVRKFNSVWKRYLGESSSLHLILRNRISICNMSLSGIWLRNMI